MFKRTCVQQKNKMQESKRETPSTEVQGQQDNEEKYPKASTNKSEKTQDEPQWIVAQRLLSTLTIPRFS